MVLILGYFLFLFAVDRCGLLDVDEPRYAWVGRAMAWSGDWVTPRLWGEPWFEKPALLYWMIAGATKLGLRDELAARVPVALTSLAFLGLYWRVISREFGARAGWYAVAMLGTSAGWVGYSHVAVTDLPLAAAFGAAMLVAMPVVARGEGVWGRAAVAGALLGVAVLAKGLVPLALAVPAVWMARRHWRELVVAGLACLAVAAPWYVACYRANGWAFLAEFFGRHHFVRATSDELQHVQRWWFYAPVLLGGMFPWTPLVGLVWWRKAWDDRRLRMLGGWAVWGLVMFSLVPNKLPGYLLPLMPAVFGLVAIRLAKADTRLWWLAFCGLLVGLIPVVGWVLPKALADGLSAVDFRAMPWGYVGVGFVLSILVAWVAKRGWRDAAVGVVTLAAVAGVVWLKLGVMPVLDREASARAVWKVVAGKGQVCVEDVGRKWMYGLNYYAGRPLKECSSEVSAVQLTEVNGRLERR
jgi:4-amino-4-deoxy-L-arabinose transferase-like glycosyltransferase